MKAKMKTEKKKNLYFKVGVNVTLWLQVLKRVIEDKLFFLQKQENKKGRDQ